MKLYIVPGIKKNTMQISARSWRVHNDSLILPEVDLQLYQFIICEIKKYNLWLSTHMTKLEWLLQTNLDITEPNDIFFFFLIWNIIPRGLLEKKKILYHILCCIKQSSVYILQYYWVRLGTCTGGLWGLRKIHQLCL